MITIGKHTFDVPADLMRCPTCKMGRMVWEDGRRGWFCTNKPRCHNGQRMGALFVNENLDELLARGVDVSELTLSYDTLLDLEMEKMEFSWISPFEAKRRRMQAGFLKCYGEDDELTPEEWAVLQRMLPNRNLHERRQRRAS